jgi:hypothetical protein
VSPPYCSTHLQASKRIAGKSSDMPNGFHIFRRLRMLKDAKASGIGARSLVRLMMRTAAVLTVLVASGLPVLGAEVQITRTSGAGCRQVGEAESHKTVCPGPAQHSVTITNRNEVMTINFGRISAATRQAESKDVSLIWRGAGPLLGNRIEWRLLQGKPVTAIVRIFTLDPQGRPLQQFLIAKVTPTGSCEIGRIDASDSGAYGTARDIAASQVNNVMCERGEP